MNHTPEERLRVVTQILIAEIGADTVDVTCRACLRIMAKDESIFFNGKCEDPCALGHET